MFKQPHRELILILQAVQSQHLTTTWSSFVLFANLSPMGEYTSGRVTVQLKPDRIRVEPLKLV
jgi:hypothetical protein